MISSTRLALNSNSSRPGVSAVDSRNTVMPVWRGGGEGGGKVYTAVDTSFCLRSPARAPSPPKIEQCFLHSI